MCSDVARGLLVHSNPCPPCAGSTPAWLVACQRLSCHQPEPVVAVISGRCSCIICGHGSTGSYVRVAGLCCCRSAASMFCLWLVTSALL
jgi:hypothetical protein